MAEFRYQGITLAGKPLQGTLLAQNRFEAQKKLNEIASEYRVRIQALHKRVPFSYKARRPGNNKILRGEITAFTAEEVRESLTRMGYQPISVQRNWLNLRLGVPQKEIVVFIRLCADLLREQFPYDEILTMLANDMENARLREVVMEIHKDLKMGKEGRQVFLKHADVLGKFTAHMLSIASTSGNMAEIYENTAKFLERSAEFKKNIRSTLFMPAFVVLAAIGALIFYVMYIFPKIAGMLLKYNIAVPPMTAATMRVSEFFQHNILWVVLAVAVPITALVAYFRSDSGRVVWHRLVISLPVVGKLIYKTSLEVFARVFHALYSGSGENIEVISIASEACRNRYLEKQIKEVVIPAMLREGRSLSDAMELSAVFPRNVIYTLRSGEESGTLREAMLRLANFYEKETTHKMSRVVDLINLAVSIFISILIVGITLISSEVGFVSPNMPGSMPAVPGR
ncbi:MAG: type II secretion system F family protein [candidate division KSB1 bacterium]|nr:type II secretion system F family protein [candidate division KSB1 bacterium]MDZ7273676.1 type II secretion system F family protein [candidate division KSB1 bacterium]MDZ7285832.1 type II secretion system F family protein [candidate division KSB1 bacterium]MDZ7298864.1 type II secretion system F family protein [candidate division KSB1 bacterium]MDZ7307090.1 type II secretion system F family protein [candidate division KSB1 bacterium]